MAFPPILPFTSPMLGFSFGLPPLLYAQGCSPRRCLFSPAINSPDVGVWVQRQAVHACPEPAAVYPVFAGCDPARPGLCNARTPRGYDPDNASNHLPDCKAPDHRLHTRMALYAFSERPQFLPAADDDPAPGLSSRYRTFPRSSPVPADSPAWQAPVKRRTPDFPLENALVTPS